MTLLETCANLESDLATYRRLKRDANVLDRFSQLKEQLDGALLRFTPIGARVVLFRNKGLNTQQVPIVQIAELRDKLSRAKSGYEKDPSSLITDRELLDALRSLPHLLDAANDALRVIWVQYANKYATGIGAIPTVLGMFPSFKPIVTRMQLLQGKIASAVSSLPASDKEWDDFHDAVRELQGLLDKLNTSPGVKKFLSAIGADGASLDLLDAEVLQWLSDNKLKGFFRVVIK